MRFYIYKIANKINGKLYIGKTTNIKKRWARHKNYPFCKTAKRDECPKLYGAIRKYGVDNFEFSIVEEFDSEEECSLAEITYIKNLDTIKGGYNISEGGDGVSSGENHPFYGKHHTQETKDKISQSHLGKKLGPASDERKEKISRALKGKEKPHHKGDGNPASKLTSKDIPVIRSLFNDGKTFVEIAKIFYVSDVSIRNVITGKTWNHIT